MYFARAAAAMTVMVEARGMASKRFRDVPLGTGVNTLTVADGVLVHGRLIDHGRPVAGAEMILSDRNHMSDYNF